MTIMRALIITIALLVSNAFGTETDTSPRFSERGPSTFGEWKVERHTSQDHRGSWDDTDRHVAIDEGLHLRRIFTSLSDEDREEWAVSAQLQESYRLAAPTCIAPWDEDRSWGDCIPGKHPEGKCMEVEIRRKDGSTPAKEVGVMFSIANELDRKQDWMSICTLLDQHGVGASAP